MPITAVTSSRPTPSRRGPTPRAAGGGGPSSLTGRPAPHRATPRRDLLRLRPRQSALDVSRRHRATRDPRGPSRDFPGPPTGAARHTDHAPTPTGGTGMSKDTPTYMTPTV